MIFAIFFSLFFNGNATLFQQTIPFLGGDDFTTVQSLNPEKTGSGIEIGSIIIIDDTMLKPGND